MSSASTSTPKGRFSTPIGDGNFLSVTVWPGKKEPDAEVIQVQIRHLEGDDWQTVARLAIYRTPTGEYRQLPDRR